MIKERIPPFYITIVFVLLAFILNIGAFALSPSSNFNPNPKVEGNWELHHVEIPLGARKAELRAGTVGMLELAWEGGSTPVLAQTSSIDLLIGSSLEELVIGDLGEFSAKQLRIRPQKNAPSKLKVHFSASLDLEDRDLFIEASEILVDEDIQTTGELEFNAVSPNGDGRLWLRGSLQAAATSLFGEQKLEVSGSVRALPEGKGRVHLLSHGEVHLLEGTVVDASGTLGGGTILIGGDFQGKGQVANAQNTFVSPKAIIKADALEQGNGGTVIIWADKTTLFYGQISARGGQRGGDGGMVEVSGKGDLAFRGEVNNKAWSGKDGTLLLDPTNVFINAGCCASNDGELGDDEILAADGGAVDFTISQSTLEALTGAVIIQANNDITIQTGLSLNCISLTLEADIDNDGFGDVLVPSLNDHILLNGASLRVSGASVQLRQVENGGVVQSNITIIAQTGSVTTDHLWTYNNFGNNSGHISITAAGDILVNGDLNASASADGESGGNIEIITSSGNITINGDVLSRNTASASAGAGDINIAAPGNISFGGAAINASSVNNQGEIIITSSTGSISGTSTLVSTTNGVSSSTAAITMQAATGITGFTNLSTGRSPISLTTASGNLVANNLSSTDANITVEATTGNITLGILDADNEGAGNVTITSGGSTTVTSINSSGITGGGGTITVVTGGDFDIANGTILVNSGLTTPGFIDITAGGDLLASNASVLDFSATYSDNASAGIVLDITGDILDPLALNASGFGGGNVNITTSGTGTVTISSIDISGAFLPGGSFTANVGGALQIPGISTFAPNFGNSGNVNITAAGNINMSGNLTSSGYDSGGTISVISTGGTVTGLNALSSSSGPTGGGSSINISGQTVNMGTLDSDGSSVSATATSGNLTTGNVFSGYLGAGAINLNASGDIQTGEVNASGNYSGGTITINGSNVTTGNLSANGGLSTGAGNINVTSTGNFVSGTSIGASSPQDGGNITLSIGGNLSSSGTIAFVANANDNGAGGTYDLTIDGQVLNPISLAATGVNFGGALTLDVGSGTTNITNINLTGEFGSTGATVTTGGNLNITGNIQTQATGANGAGGPVTVSANGSITATGINLSGPDGGGNLSLSAPNAAVQVGGNIQTATSNAQGGEVNISGTSISITGLIDTKSNGTGSSGGNVILTSTVGDVVVGQIDARGTGSNDNGGFVEVVTANNFQSTTTGNSILTDGNGGTDGTISITYDSNNIFEINSSVQPANGTRGTISTGGGTFTSNPGVDLTNNFSQPGITILKALATEPTAQPTNLTFSPVGYDQMTLNYLAATGNPDGYLIVRSQVATPVTIPVDGIVYSGTVGSEEFIDVGNLLSHNDVLLASSTTYYYTIYAYNGSGAAINYNVSGPLTGSQITGVAGAYYSRQSGNYNDAIWSNVSHTGPLAYDGPGATGTDAIIGNGHTVVLTSDIGIVANSEGLVIETGATLDAAGFQIDVGGKFEINGTLLNPGIIRNWFGNFSLFNTSGDLLIFDKLVVDNFGTGVATLYTDIVVLNGVDVLSGTLDQNGFDICDASIAPPSSPLITNLTSSSLTLTWTSGAGDAFVVAREGSTAINPDYGLQYNASPVFGSGDVVGTGNFVTFKGPATSVDITGLSPSTNYEFDIYSYNTFVGGCYSKTSVISSTTTLASTPVVTAVTIPNVSMKIGDIVTATITVNSSTETFTLPGGSTIGGFALSGITKVNNTSYTAQFTITAGGTDVAAGSNIPVNVILNGPGGNGTAFTTAIAQCCDPIDANAPTAPSLPDLASVDDLGSSNSDNITSQDAGLTLTGTAEDGALVTFTEAGLGVLGSVTATGGNYSFDFDIGSGTYSISATAEDAAGNISLASGSLSITIDTGNPTVTINQSVSQADPASSVPVSFDVVFNEAINPATFNDTDITLGGSAVGQSVTSLTNPSSDNINWVITITSTGNGTIIPSIAIGLLTDVAGNTNTASTSTDNTVTYCNILAPIVGTITQPTCTVPTGSVALSGLPAGAWTINPGAIAGTGATTILTGLAPAATYNFTVTETATGCISLASANVVINAVPTAATPIAGTITQPTCTVPTGSVALSGLPAGAWTINPGAIAGTGATTTITGLAPAATYNFTVTETATGCTSLASANVVINAVPTAATPIVGATTQPTCTVPTGSVALSGLPAGAWIINPGAIAGTGATTTISGLAPAATYNFTVTETATGCVSLASANVVINAVPTAVTPIVGTITQPTCTVPTGSVALSGLPAGAWTINPGAIAGTGATTTLSGLAPAATYNFTVTETATGCVSLASANVVINAVPVASVPVVGVITQPTCAVPTGSVALSGLPAGAWTINPGAIAGTGTTTTISGLAPAATYNFTVTETATGCISLTSANIVINAAPVVPSAPTASVTTQPTCLIAGTITVTVPAPAAGVSYTLTGTSPVVAPQNNTTGIFTGLAAGNYNVTTTVSGCTSTVTALTVNVAPGAPATPIVGTITQPTCTVPTGSVALSGLPAGAWTINPGAISGTGATTTLTGLAPAATYNFTVTETATGCTSVASANVVINAVPTAATPIVGATTQPTCTVPTGSVALSGLPAGAWTINPGAIAGTGTTTTISGLAPASTYNFIVTETATGCVSLASANVVINAVPTAATPIAGAITQPTCTVPTGSVALSGLPAGAWTINPGAIAGTGTTTTISGLAPASTYNFIVTETATGCTSVASANVVINAVPIASIPVVGIITQPTCTVPTGSVALSGLPAGAWTINPGAIAGSGATTTLTGLAPAATYNFTVTETATGCTSLASANVVINAVPSTPAAPTASVTSQPSCSVATGTITVTVPANGAGVSYTITGTSPVVAGVNNATGVFSGLAPGNYDVTTTVNGCISASTALTVNPIPNPPVISSALVTIVDASAGSNGSISVAGAVSGGSGTYTYQWFTGTGTSSPISGAVNATINNLAAGDYTVVVTDAVSGCASIPQSFTVKTISLPIVTSINYQTPSSSPTNATSLTFRVTFNVSVVNVDPADFTKTVSGLTTGNIIVNAISGSVYDVTLPVAGNGTVRIDVLSTASIADSNGNAYTSNFTTGQVYTVDQTPPVFSTTGPASNSTVTNTQVSYTLSEDLARGTITWTRTGGTTDAGSPHVQSLTSSELSVGPHPNITLTNNPVLVAGAVYTITFSGTDLAGNSSQTVTETNVTFTPPPSSLSDIVISANFSYPQNINYADFQEANNIQNSATSINVARFEVRDGGASGDADPFPTILTGITLDLGSNFSVIRRIALFNGSDNSEFTGTDQSVSSQRISFSGLALQSDDNVSSSFIVRVSFAETVTDNVQFSFTVTAVTSQSGSSGFDSSNAGGAESSTAGNNNRIEVVATKLNFFQQPSNTFVNEVMTPAVSVEAIDNFGNRDLDFAGNIGFSTTGSFNSTPTASLTSGFGTSNDMLFSISGTGFVINTTNTSGLTNATSSAFDVYEDPNTIPISIRSFVTPNSADDQNNVLYIENIEFFPENTVKLIDRWGVPIKSWSNFSNYTTPQAEQSDFNFTSLDIGNYICIVEYVNPVNGTKKSQTQMISVLK